jgi:hypothetical protein
VPGPCADDPRPLQLGRHPRQELASVPPLGPAALQSRDARAPGRQDRGGPLAGLQPRRVPQPPQEQPEDLDDAGARAPTDAVAAVLASAPPVAGGGPV